MKFVASSASLLISVGLSNLSPSLAFNCRRTSAIIGRFTSTKRYHAATMMTRSDSSSTSLLSSSNNNSNSNEETVPSPSLTYTPISSISPLITEARTSYATHFTHPYQFRLAQLDGIERLIRDNYSALSKTINLDLGQGSMYAEAFELTGMLGRISYAKSNLRQWMTTQSVPTPFPVNLNMPVHSQLTPYPRGVALIISPWNLPITLTLTPLLEAIAAGNVCVLKMSEKCVHTTSLLTELLSSGKYLDQRVVKVVNGEAEEATELLRHRFDVVSYTGGEKVGRIVNEAAAKHLTPTLLELGGKNPVFVTKNADIACAAMRIAWGKVTGNAGQLCISPDYCLVEESVKEEFVEALCKAMDEFYPVSSYSGNNGDDNSRGDVGKMISVEHAERVVSMVDSTCNVIYGGKHHDTKERFVAPTIVEATADSTVMKDEIFGPILAIVTVPDLDSAIEYVQTNFSSKGKHPLNLYLFTKSKKEQQQIMNAIPSGTCAVNDVIKHSANYYVPFGGIGTSGLGAYYGKFGFDFFSHYRGSLLVKNHSTSKLDPAVWMQFPPYNDKKIFAFRSLSKLPLIFGPLKRIAPVAKVLLPVALGGLLFWAGIMVERLKYFG
ncbi:aldehyde dehydrogenase [Skeletonema marinoi]|uniref:Aldehyde dehydrogenase n=1 Tax=Skeletonema marinoi TaxID=267567 RepID=A0AAD8YHG2_9STRA|nr:aldehyde dehydrogenase [Skeletonema marinoi]